MLLVYSSLVFLAAVASFPVLLLLSFRQPELRHGLLERLGWVPSAPPGSSPPVWFQAVSVGEVEVARRLLAELQERFPHLPCLLSSTTLAGRRLAARAMRNGGVRTFYFPLDLPLVVRHAIRRLQPRVLILVETEIWPNLLKTCARTGIPVVMVNGRISDRSYPRYRFFRFFLRQILSGVSLFCMQSERDAERILSLGAPGDRVRVTGNVKWDLEGTETSAAAVRESLAIPADSPVLVAGSTSEGEEATVLSAWEQLRADAPKLRLVLAPRHPDRFDKVAGILKDRGIPFARRSDGSPSPVAPVLLLDTIGELKRAYAAGTVCFVGGSLVGRGGQNLMEPAAQGRPVLFGPRTENFSEAAQLLLKTGAGFRVTDAASLASCARMLLTDPTACESAGRRGRDLVARNRGAARLTAESICSLLQRSA